MSYPRCSTKRAFEYRTDNTAEEDLAEQLLNEKFCQRQKKMDSKVNYIDLLLGPENDSKFKTCTPYEKQFQNDVTVAERFHCRSRTPSHSLPKGEAVNSGSAPEEVAVQSSDEHISPGTKDWTVIPLSSEQMCEVEKVSSIFIKIETRTGSSRTLNLTALEIERLRGYPKKNNLPWLSGSVMTAIAVLINIRSKSLMVESERTIHQPSGISDFFNRPRTRTHIFNSHLYQYLCSENLGGYKSVENWRRKVIHFSSVGMFMFPALVNDNHWVLAVIDVDGRQFLYYDPKHEPDTHGVMSKARSWMQNEVTNASRRDPWTKFDLSSWQTLHTPQSFPKQLDTDSCGLFVLYVAEHLDRGTRPLFTQGDIPVLRARSVLALKIQKLDNQ